MVVDPIRFSQRFCHAGWPGEKETFGVAQATIRVQRPDSSAAASEGHISYGATYFVDRHHGQAVCSTPVLWPFTAKPITQYQCSGHHGQAGPNIVAWLFTAKPISQIGAPAVMAINDINGPEQRMSFRGRSRRIWSMTEFLCLQDPKRFDFR